jgi:hypothetical protein
MLQRGMLWKLKSIFILQHVQEFYTKNNHLQILGMKYDVPKKSLSQKARDKTNNARKKLWQPRSKVEISTRKENNKYLKVTIWETNCVDEVGKHMKWETHIIKLDHMIFWPTIIFI